MADEISKSDKIAYIVVSVIFLILVVLYGVWIWYTYTNKTGFFKPYVPEPGDHELYQANKEAYQTPLSPEDEQKKQIMIENAKLSLNSPVLGFYNPFISN